MMDLRLREIMDELNASGLTGNQHVLITELVATCLMIRHRPQSSTERVQSHRARERKRVTVSDDGVYIDNNSSIKAEEEKKDTPRSILLSVLDETRTEAVIEHRKAKRAPLKAHSAKLLIAQLAKFPDPNLAADEMVLRGWGTIKPDWIKPDQSKINANVRAGPWKPFPSVVAAK